MYRNIIKHSRWKSKPFFRAARLPRGCGRIFQRANAAHGKYYLRREERRMQKALAFILAIVLTLGLAACSGDEREPNSPEPGTVWDAGQDSGN